MGNKIDLGLDIDEIGTVVREVFRGAKPFPHIVMRNYLPEDVLDDVIKEFPDNFKKGLKYRSDKEKKNASTGMEDMGPRTKALLDTLLSEEYCKWLTAATGIENLLPDPSLRGGGLHSTPKNGHLNVHVDFNRHALGYRRLNLIIYLNKDWKPHFGGELELWSKEPKKLVTKVAPEANTMVLFETSEISYHGHPHPYNSEGQPRRSLALYYYTKEDPEFAAPAHSTLFMDTR